ncbi:MAG: hypothetical protein FJX75_19800 [Armatimonadetes bacterium]|nr:hypothetical protein [Armatimonadota bacterium]
MASRGKGFFGRVRDALVPSPSVQAARTMNLQARMFADSYNMGYSLSDEVSPLTGKKKPYDFSPESLAEVDQLVDDLFHGSEPTDAVDPALFVSGAGAYFGEVIARGLGGQWAVSREGPAATPSQVELPGADGTTLMEAPFDRVADRMRSKEAPRLEAAYRDLQAGRAKGA